MKKPKKAKVNPPEDNPFIDGLLDWMDSPEGELSDEARDVVWQLLEKVAVDAKARTLIWENGKHLTLDESVQRILADNPQFPPELIESKLISWLELEYEPKDYSEKQLDELDRLTERWVEDHYRRAGRRSP